MSLVNNIMKDIFISVTFALFIYVGAIDDFSWKHIQTEKKIEENMVTTLKKAVLVIGTAPMSADKGDMTIFDFLQRSFRLLSSFDDVELKTIVQVLESEIERFYDESNGFKDLIDIPVIRRSVNTILKVIEEFPLGKCDDTERFPPAEMGVLPNAMPSNKKVCWYRLPLKLITWVESFFKSYDDPVPEAYNDIINNVKAYIANKAISANNNKYSDTVELDFALRNNDKLETITLKALQILFADQPKLDTERRDYIVFLLQSFWQDPQNNYRTQKVMKHERRFGRVIQWSTTQQPLKQTVKKKKKSTTFKPKRYTRTYIGLHKDVHSHHKTKKKLKKNYKHKYSWTTKSPKKLSCRKKNKKKQIKHTRPTTTETIILTKIIKDKKHKFRKSHKYPLRRITKVESDDDEYYKSSWNIHDVIDEGSLQNPTFKTSQGIFRKSRTTAPRSTHDDGRRKKKIKIKHKIKYISSQEYEEPDHEEVKVIKRRRKRTTTSTENYVSIDEQITDVD